LYEKYVSLYEEDISLVGEIISSYREKLFRHGMAAGRHESLSHKYDGCPVLCPERFSTLGEIISLVGEMISTIREAVSLVGEMSSQYRESSPS
jgi:hypothetical protein